MTEEQPPRRRRRRPRRRPRGQGGRGGGGAREGAAAPEAGRPEPGPREGSRHDARDTGFAPGAGPAGGERGGRDDAGRSERRAGGDGRPRSGAAGPGARAGGGGRPGGPDGAGERPQPRGRQDRARHGARGNRPHVRGRARGRSRFRPQHGKARHTRPAENWWARRWIEVLESFDVGRRLGRGRNYARQGQVAELEIGKGFVTALVQGSRDAPYLVRMRLSMLSSTDWKKVTRAIAQDPDLVHALVSGQMPEHIEEAFEPLDLSLFPTVSGDLKAACSCPDQANPCKHIAAVYYLLGEEFDRDPFLIFRLRGIDRNEIIEAIGGPAALRGPHVPAPTPPPELRAAREPEVEPEGEGVEEEPELPAEPRAARREEAAPEAVPAERPPEPLPSEPHAFWAGEGPPPQFDDEVRIPAVPGALVRRLGGFPFYRGREDVAIVADRTYRNGSVAGVDVYLGETETRED